MHRNLPQKLLPSAKNSSHLPITTYLPLHTLLHQTPLRYRLARKKRPIRTLHQKTPRKPSTPKLIPALIRHVSTMIIQPNRGRRAQILILLLRGSLIGRYRRHSILDRQRFRRCCCCCCCGLRAGSAAGERACDGFDGVDDVVVGFFAEGLEGTATGGIAVGYWGVAGGVQAGGVSCPERSVRARGGGHGCHF